MQIDWRYDWKQIPKEMDVKCPRCGVLVKFSRTVFDPPSYVRKRLRTYRRFKGKIACLACGCNKVSEISWPDQAYYQTSYRGIFLWAWNRDYLLVLLDWISSRIRKEDDYSQYIYFLACLPRSIVLARIRAGLINKINKML